jgi:hypothetical protein
MAGMRRRYDLEKLISEGNIPVIQQLPDDINVNQLKWGLRGKLESLNAITLEGQEIASVDNYPMIEEQIQRLESLLDQEILSLKNEILKIYQLQAGQKSEWSMIEVEQQKKQEEREVQLTEELQNKWQDVLEKINNVPQAIEEQLQLQQSAFIQEISGIISELAVLRQDKEHWEKKQEERESQLTKELQDKWQEVLGKMDAFPQGIEEQLQLQQSIFMQEISTIISELVVLQQDKEQREREQIAAEVRQLMDEMEAHMLEEVERQKKQEERESQLTKELQNKWQDVLGKIDAFPQGIEEQLQQQQSVFMQEVSRIISELTVLQQDKEQREREQTAGNNVEWNVTEEIRHLMDEMEFYMLEEAERQKKQEEREAQLTKELQDKWQNVLGKIDTFPQGIEEQLQQQQSVFMQEFSRIISELAVLQQDKEQREREQTVTGNTGWNVAEEVRHLIDEMGVHMLEEAERQKKQEEREAQLTKELQDKWQDVLGKIDAFPQGIEEQLQLQQSVFMQEISRIISELAVLQQDKEQGGEEKTAGNNVEWNVAEEIRHLMDEMKAHMFEEGERQKKQEERKSQLTNELQNKWQDVLGKIDGFPQAIEEQLQQQQSVFMQEVSGKIDAFPQAIEEQLQLQQSVFMQEVSGRIEAFPQGIKEQLQQQQSVFMQEISRIISELAVLQQDKEQGGKEQTAGNNAEWNVAEEIRHLMDEMKDHMLEESERQKKQEERKSQLTNELQNKWQDVLGKIDGFPQAIEEQLQQQQSVFIQDVLGKIDGFPQAIEEQLQQQQSVFMQEFSRIISELTVLQQDKEQREREQTAGNNAEWNVTKEIRHLMDEMEFYMLEESERQKKQEEREAQLTKELQDKWQDVLGKLDAFPQGIEEQLQLQQSVFMQEISRIISELTVLQQDKEQEGKEQAAEKNLEWNVAEEIRHLMDEMKAHMFEEGERQKKQEERESQLTKELQNKWQDVLGKLDAFPQGIEEQLQQQQSIFMPEISTIISELAVLRQDKEQLQLQQSVFMQEISRIISELTVLQQDKEQGGEEKTAGNNAEWNVAEEIRYLMDEMKAHMLEESERQKKQEERKSQLTNELQNKWQDVLGKIEGFPQAIEEQLQLQQSVFMQEVSGKIDAFPQAIEEQLQLQQSVFMQEVSGKIDAFPQAIEEQLQQQQSVFMQDVLGKIDAFPQGIEEQLQLQQDKEQREREQIAAEIRHLMDEMKAHMLEESERQKKQEERESQLTKELQDKWQGVLGKLEAFPQGIEEQLQQQQSIFMPEISTIISELAVLRQDKEQLQLQQSVFMQEISRIISELTVLQQDKEQGGEEKTAGNNAEWNVAEEIRYLMDEMKAHMLEESERQKKQEERKSQLTNELQNKWQDVLGKIEGFPQAIEEQLQLQQSVFMQEVSGKIDAFPQAIEEQLQLQQSVFMQEVSGKIDAFPQAIEEQLQQQQSVFMQDVLGKIDAFPQGIEEQLQLQQDKEQREREQIAAEIRHLMGEMKAHMLEESERQKKQEERESQLTKELQDKWQGVLGKLEAFPQGIEEQLQLQQSIFMPEISTIISELAVLRQDKEQLQLQQSVFMQDVLGKLEAFPQGIEEQLQLQQSIFMPEISTIISELAVLRQDKEQLQLQQSEFMQEISRIISELTVLQQDKEQGEKEQIAGKNLEWSVVEETRHLMGEMKAHMFEEGERQEKQEERESQLTKELQDKWQDVLGKLEAFPQGIEERLQLQQSVFMQDVSGKIDVFPQAIEEQLQQQQSLIMQEVSRIISELAVLQQDKEQGEKEETTGKNLEWNVAEEIHHLMDEMKAHMLEEGERQRKQEERESQLANELQSKWQDVLGKIDAFPQEIEEQLQQSVFMQGISRIISELTVLQQDKERWEREEKVGDNMEWNVEEEVRHLKDEMGAIRHMLEEVAEYSRRLTEISQQKDLISGEVSLLKAELIALRKTQEQANEQIEQQHSIEESVVCPQMIKAQLQQQQGNMLNYEILSLKEELAFIRELYENRLKRKKRRH